MWRYGALHKDCTTILPAQDSDRKDKSISETFSNTHHKSHKQLLLLPLLTLPLWLSERNLSVWLSATKGPFNQGHKLSKKLGNACQSTTPEVKALLDNTAAKAGTRSAPATTSSNTPTITNTAGDPPRTRCQTVAPQGAVYR